jgi:hypothetical protein
MIYFLLFLVFIFCTNSQTVPDSLISVDKMYKRNPIDCAKKFYHVCVTFYKNMLHVVHYNILCHTRLELLILVIFIRMVKTNREIFH